MDCRSLRTVPVTTAAIVSWSVCLPVARAPYLCFCACTYCAIGLFSFCLEFERPDEGMCRERGAAWLLAVLHEHEHAVRERSATSIHGGEDEKCLRLCDRCRVDTIRVLSMWALLQHQLSNSTRAACLEAARAYICPSRAAPAPMSSHTCWCYIVDDPLVDAPIKERAVESQSFLESWCGFWGGSCSIVSSGVIAVFGSPCGRIRFTNDSAAQHFRKFVRSGWHVARPCTYVQQEAVALSSLRGSDHPVLLHYRFVSLATPLKGQTNAMRAV